MRRSAAWVLALGTVACGGPAPTPSATPAPGPAVDLLAELERAELRSDTLTWPLLRPALAFDAGTWEAAGPDGSLRSRRAACRIWLTFASAGDKELRLRLRAGGASGRALKVGLRLNGHALEPLALAGEEAEFTRVLAADRQQGGPNRLELEVPAPREDRRAFRHFVLSRLEVAPVAAARAPEEDGLWLPPGAELSLYVAADPQARLELAVRAGSGPGHVSVALDEDEGRRRLLDLALRPGDRARRELPLGVASAGPARLLLSGDGPGLRIERLRLTRPASPAPRPVRLAGRPSVIVYLVDTLRTDVLGAYGGPAEVSPRFDAFAHESIVFTGAQAQSSWTLPSVASIFTGRDPDALGIYGPWGDLDAGAATLAEAFAGAGYATGGFVANALMTRARGYAQGFEEWREEERPTSTGRAAGVVVAEALEWLSRQERPAFLYAHVMEPHAPYGERGRELSAVSRKTAPLAAEVQSLRAAYREDVRRADAAFGALLDGLRASGRLEDALVVFVSDHGEEFFEHGGQGHGKTLYQEVVRVPLAVRLPRAARKGREAAPIQHADLLPTLLALAGVPAPEAVEGRELSPLWASGLAPAPAALTTRLLFERRTYDKVAASLGALKLIVNEEADAPRRFEMYDLVQDPGETRDVSALHPVAAGFLLGEIRLRRRVAVAAGGAAARPAPPRDADARERLRALGYVE